jgi:hypothetical protein
LVVQEERGERREEERRSFAETGRIRQRDE